MDTKTDKPFERSELPQDVADETLREEAWKRIKARRKMVADLISYVVINAFLVVMWALTGRGYFWPGWVLGGWGALLLIQAWETYLRRPVTQADIDAELRRRL